MTLTHVSIHTRKIPAERQRLIGAGAQLRDNPEEREKCGNPRKTHQPPHRHCCLLFVVCCLLFVVCCCCRWCCWVAGLLGCCCCCCFGHVFNSVCVCVCVSTAVNAMQQSPVSVELIICVMSSPLKKLLKTAPVGSRRFPRSLTPNLPLLHNRNFDDCRQTATAATPRDSTVKPGHLSLHSNGSSTTFPRNCTEES